MSGFVHRERFLEHYAEHRKHGCPGKSCTGFMSEMAGVRQLSLPPESAVRARPASLVDWARRYGLEWLRQQGHYVHVEGPEHARDDAQTVALKVASYGYGVESNKDSLVVEIRRALAQGVPVGWTPPAPAPRDRQGIFLLPSDPEE